MFKPTSNYFKRSIFESKNKGTAMKFSVRIKLPHLSKDGRLGALLKLLNLNNQYRIIDETQHRDLYAEEDDRKSSILEIASKISLGKTEVIYIETIYSFFK